MGVGCCSECLVSACYRMCRLKRETMQGVYGEVILGQRGKQPDTVENRNLLGAYWSNPLHVGKEDSQEDMIAEDRENPFHLVQEEDNILMDSLEEEDNLILANPVFMMKSAFSSATRKEGTAKHEDYPLDYKIDMELETRGVTSSVLQAESREVSDAHSHQEIGNQSATSAPHSNTAWERFDNSDRFSSEGEDRTTAGTVHKDLSNSTTSIDGEECDEVEEQRAAVVCLGEEEAAQEAQLL